MVAFLIEFLAVSKGIETRRILSRIPPWAAISTWSYKTPVRSGKATYVKSYVGGRLHFHSESIISSDLLTWARSLLPDSREVRKGLCAKDPVSIEPHEAGGLNAAVGCVVVGFRYGLTSETPSNHGQKILRCSRSSPGGFPSGMAGRARATFEKGKIILPCPGEARRRAAGTALGNG